MRSLFDTHSVVGIVLFIACSLTSGCRTVPPDRALHPAPEHYSEVNAAMVRALNRSSIDAAILEQHTLYPYHFVRNSAELNDLGRRDLDVLLAHYAEFAHPGTTPLLNVRRTETPEPLYDARIRRVAQLIADGGIDARRIEVTDGMPGGDGVTSDRAILILGTEHRAVTEGRQPLDAGAQRGIGIGGRGGR